MEKEDTERRLGYELDEEEKAHIRELFLEDIVPKLLKHHARLGNLSCEFAGDKYRKWMLQFESKGSGFEIVDFEYDEEGDGIELDL